MFSQSPLLGQKRDLSCNLGDADFCTREDIKFSRERSLGFVFHWCLCNRHISFLFDQPFASLFHKEDSICSIQKSNRRLRSDEQSQKCRLINNSFLRKDCPREVRNVTQNDRNTNDDKRSLGRNNLVSRYFFWFVTTIRDSSFSQLQFLRKREELTGD